MGPDRLPPRRFRVVWLALVLLVAVAPPAWAQDLPDPRFEPAEVRERADDILDRREFQRPEPNLFERIQRWFSEAIGRLLESLLGGGGGSLVGWAILLAAIGLIVFFATRVTRTVQADAGRRRPDVLVEPDWTAAKWRARAEEHERSGQWKAALRCRYRALIAELADRGVVPEVPGRTAGEYRAEVAVTRPTVAGEFGGATELFERAWYGAQPTGPDENARFRGLADEVLEGSAR